MNEEEKVAGAKKKHRGFWQTALDIDVKRRVIKLKSARGIEYEKKYMAWEGRFSPVDAQKLLQNGEKVRVLYEPETATIHAVYHEKKIDRSIVSGKTEKAVPHVPPHKKVLTFGGRPQSLIDDPARIEFLPSKNKKWEYIIHLWQIKKIEYEDYHKVSKMFVYDVAPVKINSRREFDTEKEAMKDAIYTARNFIIEHVLGRDYTLPLPAEDHFSLLGRKWLGNLEEIAKVYLKENVKFADAPAGVRYVDASPLQNGAWLFTQDKSVGMIVGVKPEDIETIKPILTGREIFVNVAFLPDKPFVKIGNGVYNLYHIAGVIEAMKYDKSLLKKSGEFRDEMVRKGVVLSVKETKRDLLILNLGTKAMVLAQSRGVDEKYIQEAKTIRVKGKAAEEEKKKIEVQQKEPPELEEAEEEEM